MPSANTLGDRLRRLRLASGLGQQDLAERARIAAGTVSMVERGRASVDSRTIDALAQVLDVDPDYFARAGLEPRSSTPQLRAYADASQKTVDRVQSDSETAVIAISEIGLRLVDDALPLYDGDRNDELEIERFAEDVRSQAGLPEGKPVGNAIRAAERLGCVVLPMDSELGRHMGMSLRVDNLPVVRVSRSSTDPTDAIPGDRQRFTVAHEIGHLVLHAGLEAPLAPTEANRREQEAHRFASAFLAPGDAVLDDLHRLGGRVTLSTLTRMKEKWGYSIKAFVVRFRQLGVIDDDHARSLYKQISARRWNKVEPVAVGNESAVWFSKAAAQMGSTAGMPAIRSMSLRSGLGEAYFHRWMEWSPRQSEAQSLASVSKFTPRKPTQSTEPQTDASISFLPFARHS
ncbi:ImmA/IrrE family metallo-endopeptidase [Microbacterium sp.]|jgi:Zn-dependent peptidase ImmA (M78 family)/DNA-binding XRE family transcriptional regulator|uniref:ImmA/IrrE family metallo-endopeptidase n=1 Tax=Microbacterium sp. TaxID=51671 RepID=UPI0025CFEB91|nr:ImmA/IrrE family metallo-endopeptidase [Microbacterium sp.]MBT9605861.1 helix-turn-helix domain-containing protein [Microbacterium sp.]